MKTTLVLPCVESVDKLEGYIIGRADQYAEDKIKIQNIINGF